MATDPQFPLYSEEDVNRILERIDSMRQGINNTTQTVVTKLHDLNVSSKDIIKITKEEGVEILNAFILFNKILHDQTEWFDELIRAMAPSLRFAREVGPAFVVAYQASQDAQMVTVPVTD